MQQDRSLKGPAKKQSYQFMLRLKMPCGEVPGPLYAELDDISNLWGHVSSSSHSVSGLSIPRLSATPVCCCGHRSLCF